MVKFIDNSDAWKDTIFKVVSIVSNGIFAHMYYDPNYIAKDIIFFNRDNIRFLPVPTDYLAEAEKIKNHDTYQKPLPMGMCRLPKLKLVGDRLAVDDSSAFRTNHIMPKIKKSIGVLDHREILKDSFRN